MAKTIVEDVEVSGVRDEVGTWKAVLLSIVKHHIKTLLSSLACKMTKRKLTRDSDSDRDDRKLHGQRNVLWSQS